MLVRNIALACDDSQIKSAELSRVAAALQKQVTRDFAPIWNVKATVDSFTDLNDIPLGYWPVIVMDGVKDAAGYHDDDEGQPFALVEYDRDWPLTASHEVLEMLADPFGRRLVAGPEPLKKNPRRVAFLLEVCDPSEGSRFGYTVNGVPVSDFYTPDYFDPVPIKGKKYSFTGAITEPRQVLEGGYLSWREPVSKEWFQLQWFGRKQKVDPLGAKKEPGSLRSWIDRKTEPRSKAARVVSGSEAVERFRKVHASSALATHARAGELRSRIAELTGRGSGRSKGAKRNARKG